jgi:hypothetical protein
MAFLARIMGSHIVTDVFTCFYNSEFSDLQERYVHVMGIVLHFHACMGLPHIVSSSHVYALENIVRVVYIYRLRAIILHATVETPPPNEAPRGLHVSLAAHVG